MALTESWWEVYCSLAFCICDQAGRCAILLYPLPGLVLDQRRRCPAPSCRQFSSITPYSLGWKSPLAQDLDSPDAASDDDGLAV